MENLVAGSNCGLVIQQATQSSESPAVLANKGAYFNLGRPLTKNPRTNAGRAAAKNATSNPPLRSGR